MKDNYFLKRDASCDSAVGNDWTGMAAFYQRCWIWLSFLERLLQESSATKLASEQGAELSAAGF